MTGNQCYLELHMKYGTHVVSAGLHKSSGSWLLQKLQKAFFGRATSCWLKAATKTSRTVTSVNCPIASAKFKKKKKKKNMRNKLPHVRTRELKRSKTKQNTHPRWTSLLAGNSDLAHRVFIF